MKKNVKIFGRRVENNPSSKGRKEGKSQRYRWYDSKKYIIGFLLGLFFVSSLAYGADAITQRGGIGILFERITGTENGASVTDVYRLNGKNIKDNTVTSAEIQNETITQSDIDTKFSLWNRETNGTIFSDGDVGIGKREASKFTKGPGNRLSFRGGTGEFGNNTDSLSFYRYDGAVDQSDLRLHLGDNIDSTSPNTDRFVIGGNNSSDPTNTFVPKFVFKMGAQAKLGIGTEAPKTALHIDGKENSTIRVDSPSSKNSFLQFYNNDNSGDSLHPAGWSIGKDAGNGGNLTINFDETEGVSKTKLMTFTKSGSIGVGTTSPKRLFDVNGTIRANTYEALGSFRAKHGKPDAGNNTNRGFAFETDADTGLFTHTGSSAETAAGLGMYINNKLGVYATNKAGANIYVGIGTDNPKARLDVDGDALINGITAGRGGGNDLTNVVFGVNALKSPTNTGEFQMAFGYNVLLRNTTGTNNIAFGDSALSNNTTGHVNTALGSEALKDNISGSYNVAVGDRALYENTTASNLVAIGHSALENNTIGGENTAVGFYALKNNTKASENTAVGFQALMKLKPTTDHDSDDNTAVGKRALASLGVGGANTGIGEEALRYLEGGHGNVALGETSLGLLKGGNENIGIGRWAFLGTDASNKAIGFTQGDYNIALGHKAGKNLVSGSRNIVIGTDATLPSSTGSNQLSIGNWIYGRDGKIGIGTVNPLAKLQVNGDVNIGITTKKSYNSSASNTGPKLSFLGGADTTGYSGADNTDPLQLYRYNSGSDTSELRMVIGDNPLGHKDSFKIGVTNDGEGKTDDFTPAFTFRSDGYMGIGTEPKTRLHIKGNGGKFTKTQPFYEYPEKSIFGAHPRGFSQVIESPGTDEGGMLIGVGDDNGDESALLIWNTTHKKESFDVHTNGNTYIAGLLGLGVVNPQAKLDIAGKIKITDGTQGAGKTLISDANGLSSWSETGAYPCKPGGKVVSNLCYGNGALQGGASVGAYQMAFGINALANNTTGGNNHAFGDSALRSNTTGKTNTALGSETLRDNISGSYNVAVGDRALFENTQGTYNTALGANALEHNLISEGNVAVGKSALLYNGAGVTSSDPGHYGDGNTAVGQNTLLHNTTGWNNTALGRSALYNNVAGNDNTAVGAFSLINFKKGTNNTALGNNTLRSLREGNANIGVGYALPNLQYGLGNTSVGFHSLRDLREGRYNTALGNGVFSTLISGSYNIGLGDAAGTFMNEGSQNTIMGRWAGTRGIGGDNNIFLGAFAGSAQRYVGYDPSEDTTTTGSYTVTYVTDSSVSISPAINLRQYPVGSLLRVVKKTGGIVFRTGTFEVKSATSLEVVDVYNSFTTAALRPLSLGTTADAGFNKTAGVNIYTFFTASFASESPKIYSDDGREKSRYLTVSPALPPNVTVGSKMRAEFYGLTTKMSIPGNQYFIVESPTRIRFEKPEALDDTTDRYNYFLKGNSGDTKKDTTVVTPSFRVFQDYGNINKLNDQIIIGVSAGSIRPGGDRTVIIGRSANAADQYEPDQLSIQNTIYGRNMNSVDAKIGIGTTNPQAKLDVNGDALINGITVGRGGGNKDTNTVLGKDALYNKTIGDYNVAVGHQALRTNTTGRGNTALGSWANGANTTGTRNVSIGWSTATFLSTGNRNTAIGTDALNYNVNGNDNVAIGDSAGLNLTTGNYNIAIGKSTSFLDKTGSNQLNIGNWIYGKDGNIGIGVNNPTQKFHVNGNTLANGYFYTSDKRLKKDISKIDNALDIVKKLKGFGFTWKETGKKSFGLIAQEVEKVLPELVHTDENGYKSVEYANLVAFLIEGMKEQETKIAELELKIEKQEKSIKDLQEQIDIIKKQIK